MTDLPVISLGCSTGGLAVIRALARNGVPVVAMTHDPRDIGLASKYVTERAICPHPRDLDAFGEFMLNRASRWSGSLIIESGDYYAVALSKLKEELSPHYRFVTQEWGVLSQFVDKKLTSELAETCGVPYPRTFHSTSLEELAALEETIRFPCILKPNRSHEFVALFNTKLFAVDSFDELVEKFRLCLEHRQPVIIQEIVPGDDTAFERIHIYLNSRGQVGAEVHHKAFRLSPPKYGVMRAGTTVPVDKESSVLAYRLLECAGYDSGVAAFQFKRNPMTNELMLIEVNGRMPRSVQIDIAGGVDIPGIIYRDIMCNDQTPVDGYQETTWIEFWPDVLNAILNDDKSEFSLREFFRPYRAANRTFAVFSASDPRPFIKQTMSLPRLAKGKLWPSKRSVPSASGGPARLSPE